MLKDKMKRPQRNTEKLDVYWVPMYLRKCNPYIKKQGFEEIALMGTPTVL